MTVEDAPAPPLLQIAGFEVELGTRHLTDTDRLSRSDLKKVVLDTNILLETQADTRKREALRATWDPASTVYVVPTIVWAELATKTHPESVNPPRPQLADAANKLILTIVQRLSWPMKDDPPLCVVALRRIDQITLAMERHRDKALILWNWDGNRNHHNPSPAMADHQVARTASALKALGHDVCLCTKDKDLANYARARGFLDEAFNQTLAARGIK